ncbi:hypothetical protein SAMN05216535_3043 [Stutzerimonas xanthomarina]|uniref:Uncharacterized protein n=2 Tax=Stutzerimonas xanthomarina TaxID=271420 RepID=A0A1M5RH74_9GAMM|nr:hypothetical protein SAMN05216535_3043 [Stutzerimonas xanthomarina]SHH25399.1 hypothetical protein SAMN02744645_3038 [Stutzerimonas xanthomarina DSM 18231]
MYTDTAPKPGNRRLFEIMEPIVAITARLAPANCVPLLDKNILPIRHSPTLILRPAAIAKGVSVTARAVRLESHNR